MPPDSVWDYLRQTAGAARFRVTADGRTMTAGALFEKAEGLGRTLTRGKYGILYPSQLDTAVALLACFAAGKTAVPLSGLYGGEHVERIVDAVRLSRLLTDGGESESAAERPEMEDLSAVPLIMCTSGTTGRPKGAMITHRGLIANLEDIAAYFSIGPGDRLLIARPLYHCAVLTGEFLAGLAAGADIHFHDGGFQPAVLLQAIISRKITVMGGTPTLFYHLCRLALRQGGGLPLRAAVVSGECMTPAVAALMRRAMPEARIYSVYGLTEASPRVSWLDPDQFDSHPLSVGVPLRSVEARVEDGELLVRGPNVMRGYYGDPDATARALRDGWLHTGDAAEADEDGRLTIRGRLDDMIIRAGVNIYPQEIENALRRDPDIREVMAYGAPAAGGLGQSIRLAAVTALSRGEVFELCRRVLPAYLLPDDIAIVPALARNASGKLLRGGRKEEETAC